MLFSLQFMPWYRKEQSSPFHNSQIPGLQYLHGDIIAKRYHQKWAEGKKYPLITFPSGVTREVHRDETTQTVLVHIFDGLHITYFGNRDDAAKQAFRQGREHGYLVSAGSLDSFIVADPYTSRRYELLFDEAEGHLANIVIYPTTVPELLDATARALLPPLRHTREFDLDAIAPIKFYSAVAHWTWYPTEFDGDDIFFGLVSGYEVEYGIFSLTELEEVNSDQYLQVQRDLDFTPTSLRVLEALHRR